ncbi:Hsp20/alpha crystallin family protein [Laceyella putida]|uniref:Hsp20/alpha crystallin family protein n=1 Tax=Laceyella putida TaxID=110101 RepID=A0ABW2RN22_9BACL
MKSQLANKGWNQLARQFLGDDFFEDILAAAEEHKGPVADVYHGKNEVIVVVDLPGMENIQSLEMKVEDNTLWLTGRFPSPYNGYRLAHAERSQGEFQKMIPLGAPVSKNYTSARYRRGVLEIRFNKLASKKGSTKLRIKEQGHKKREEET